MHDEGLTAPRRGYYCQRPPQLGVHCRHTGAGGRAVQDNGTPAAVLVDLSRAVPVISSEHAGGGQLLGGSSRILWIPAMDQRLQAKPMVCANMSGRGHRGKVSTLDVDDLTACDIPWRRLGRVCPAASRYLPSCALPCHWSTETLRPRSGVTWAKPQPPAATLGSGNTVPFYSHIFAAPSWPRTNAAGEMFDPTRTQAQVGACHSRENASIG